MRSDKGAFTLEWRQITPHNYTILQSLWPLLQSIFVDAFLPVVKSHAYAHDPKAASMPAEKRLLKDQKVVATITRSLKVEWDKKTRRFHAGLQNQPFSASYVVLAKGSQGTIIGFALLKEEPLKDLLKTRLLNVTEGSLENDIFVSDAHDEISVELIAVKPDIQNRGVGKALLFAVFDHCPHIKKIYLTTSASDSNTKTQGFYEHVGFTRVVKGVFADDESGSGARQEKIVYLYQRP